jgi:NAD(P)-dependent dehydrogenase (short-subunit alcohol dehydrogenase family)
VVEHRAHAVITGGGSGIGAALVALLAREGWRVAVLDRDGDAARRVAQAAGAEHLDLAVDVSREDGAAAAFAEVAARFGHIDGLATCAGILDTTPFLETEVDTFRRLHDVNVIGTFLAMREAAKYMPRGAAICTLSSIAGLRGGGTVGTAAYAATKGAVLALTKTAARALSPLGIRVNCVAPGPTLTPMIEPHFSERRLQIEAAVPMGRAGTPEEIAEAIAWLLSPRSSFMDGATVVVDGGMVMH